MSNILTLPILVPMVSGIGALLAYRLPSLQRWIGLFGAFALLICDLVIFSTASKNQILVLQLGGWPAPFGITLVADLLSTTMLLLTGIVGFVVAWYSLGAIDEGRVAHGYFALFHFLLMGVGGAFLTGDMFNLYVWFEVMLMSSFVLLALGGERRQMQGAIKYVTLNLISSAMFLAALGILYGMAGTLNMADLARKFAQVEGAQPQALITALAVLFMAAFGIKAAIFPLFFWLPASYHTPPAAVSAIFAGLLTKVGVYALIRVFTLIFVQDTGYTHTLILILSGLTMLIGVLGAMAQNEFRRVLSFHIVSQIGYMIMGLGLFTPLALAGSVFYIAHHIIVKTNLFLISGVAENLAKTPHLKKMGGLYRSQPALAMLFLIPAMSLAGIPPLSGFFAKFGLIVAGLEVGQYLIVAVALGVSLLTLYSMIKLWNEAFWKPAPKKTNDENTKISLSLLIPIGLMAAITILIGLGIGPIFSLAIRAGEQLADPAIYIQAVLGVVP
ncbi:MAG: Na+/H+ antiporter subunit D [Chloroflexi bacterium]|nr:Na+/H+ antiporter subunit D [Chloroflexota bacterium]